MKKNLNLLYTLLAVFGLSVAFTSCEEKDLTYQSADAFHFESTSASVDEDSQSPSTMSIIYTKTTPVAGSVTISTSGTATEGTDYILLTGTTYDFGADEYTKEVQIQPLPNTDITGDKELIITMTSGSATLGFPGDSALFSSYTLTLVDNDVAPVASLAGTYDVVGNGFTGDGSGGNANAVTDLATSVTFTDVGGGAFELNDPSFGLYPLVWGIAEPGVGVVTDAGGVLTLEAGYADQYGDPWTFSGTASGDYSTINCSWSNTYGDNLVVEGTKQ